MNKRMLLFGFGLFLLGVACLPGAEPAVTPAPGIGLGEAFTLRLGEETVVAGQMRLHFQEVLEDSRCPAEVQCIWEGQAIIAAAVNVTGGEPAVVHFNTNPVPDNGGAVATVDGYQVQLVSLDPYPQRADEPIPAEAYEATFVVTAAE